MKILLADDHESSAEAISAIFGGVGHEVVRAKTPTEAAQIYQTQHPDFIILSYSKKENGNIITAKKIRKIENDDWIPILGIFKNLPESSSSITESGIDDIYVGKIHKVLLLTKLTLMQHIIDMRAQLFTVTQELYSFASHDALTGVYNRQQFERNVKELMTMADYLHYMVAILFIDVDNFKAINDTYGHYIGDQFLTHAARRLQNNVRDQDIVARIGGDKFCIVLKDISDTSEITTIANKIIRSLAEPFTINQHKIRSGVSVGISVYPTMADTKEELVLNSCIAMYHAKQSGKNQYQFFSEALRHQYDEQIQLENALRFAIERNELQLNYQPIFAFQSGKLVGIETLVQWHHPIFGIIPPKKFIPVADEIGIMGEINQWIYQTSARQVAAWMMKDKPGMGLSLNVTSKQFLNPLFKEQLKEFLNISELAPQQLTIEISESFLTENEDIEFQHIIRQVHDMGINIAIDDFGTGSSSLVRLCQLPVSKIKIDNYFVQDAIKNQSSAVIVSTLIALGRSLGITIIAEGVETREQFEFLFSKGCKEGQGFYLCKPLSAKRMAMFLNKHPEVIESSS